MNFLITILDVMLAPVNTIVSTLFPDLNGYISLYYNVIDNYITQTAYWFISILPTNSRFLIVYYLTFLVSYYTIYYVVLVLCNVFKLIRNIKFW